jgi:protein-tyrosine phosphatase
MFNNILVLCTGNICRSPIAEAVLRARHARAGVTVASAGTSALVGHPADPLAIDVARKFGHDLGKHRGQQAVTPLLKSADLVLVMTREHADWVHERLPPMRGRVHLLGRWSLGEIADPYGEGPEAFATAYQQIDACVGDWLPRL